VERAGEGLWNISVDAGKEFPIFLVYKPTKATQHKFQLPVSILGKLKYSLPLKFQGQSADFSREVNAESLTPPLSLSEMVVDFGNRVLLNENSKSAYHITTILSNDSTNTLQWELGLNYPDIANGSFILEPRRGTLEKGQKASVRISFYPRDNRFYSSVVPFYLDGSSQQYLEFEVKGFGTYPMITFDVREVVLPIVPLGIKSTATFTITNQVNICLQALQ
jgi:hypothetical protein